MMTMCWIVCAGGAGVVWLGTVDPPTLDAPPQPERSAAQRATMGKLIGNVLNAMPLQTQRYHPALSRAAR
jgi:hypothetical protein